MPVWPNLTLPAQSSLMMSWWFWAWSLIYRKWFIWSTSALRTSSVNVSKCGAGRAYCFRYFSDGTGVLSSIQTWQKTVWGNSFHPRCLRDLGCPVRGLLQFILVSCLVRNVFSKCSFVPVIYSLAGHHWLSNIRLLWLDYFSWRFK